jgi:hypothetical protein
MFFRIASLRFSLGLACVLATAACQREAPPEPAQAAPAPGDEPEAVENGAISVAPVTAPPRAIPVRKNPRKGDVDWAPVALEPGQASISCELDYEGQGDGTPLPSLDRESITGVLELCREHGLLRLRYHGRIDAKFVSLVERVAYVANRLEFRKHVLDLDSAGGQVEDAMRIGDFIAETRWTVWVREDSICHSACVFLLSAGDVRRIAGKVGIHRIIRMSSTASTRAELNAELRVVQGRVRDYLERNGTGVAVADLMMAVPNRSLRLLTDEELQRFGLDGVNPAQDDLDRLRLQRECGDDFVARRDGFARAYDRKCHLSGVDLHDINACGLALRKQYGFPDPTCPAESPLSEFDLGQAEPEPTPESTPAPEDASSPGTDAPGTDAPGTHTPGTHTPGTDMPGTDVPGADAQGADAPARPVAGRAAGDASDQAKP